MSLNAFLLVISAGLLTYLPRLLPILVLKNARLPLWFQKWMSFLPITIFASLIATDIFFWEGNFQLNAWENAKLLPSLLTLFVAYKTKNMILSIATGLISISLLIWLL